MAPTHKIAFVANTSWSIYKFRLYLLEELIKNGMAVFVLAPRDAYTARFENLPGLTFVELRHLKAKSISPLQDMLLRSELTNHYRSIRPALVFHYTIKANIFGSMAARRAHVPSVSVVTGLGYTFSAGGWLRRAAGFLYRQAWRHKPEIWVLNEDDRNVLIATHLAAPRQITVLPGEGVDAAAFFPAPYDPAARNPVTFLFIGRIIRSKGIEEFVRAAQRLREAGLPVRCQVLGFFDTNPAAVPRTEVEEWARDSAVDWLGPTDNVVPYIEKADCIVLPSYGEGMPLSLLEGASMCKALIAGDSPGCRTLVNDGVNGYLCRVRDSGHLAEKMSAYYRLQPDEKRRMGIAAREKVLAGFTRKHIIDIYMNRIKAGAGFP